MAWNYVLAETMYMLSKEPTSGGVRFYHEGPTAIFFTTVEKGREYHDNSGVRPEFGLAVLEGWARILDVCDYLKGQGIEFVGVNPTTQKFLVMKIDSFIRDVTARKRWDSLDYGASTN